MSVVVDFAYEMGLGKKFDLDGDGNNEVSFSSAVGLETVAAVEVSGERVDYTIEQLMNTVGDDGNLAHIAATSALLALEKSKLDMAQGMNTAAVSIIKEAGTKLGRA